MGKVLLPLGLAATLTMFWWFGWLAWAIVIIAGIVLLSALLDLYTATEPIYDRRAAHDAQDWATGAAAVLLVTVAFFL